MVHHQTSRTTALAALALLGASLPALAGAAEALVRGEVVDGATGKPVACRIYIQDSKGGWLFPRSDGGTAVRYEKQNWVNKDSFENHTSLSAHPFEIALAPGSYTITVERGKEYRDLVRTVEVKDAPVTMRLPLERWIDMASRGWYSGDTHLHRGLDELPVAIQAEDLNVAFAFVWWVTKAFTPPSAGDKSVQVPAQDIIAVDRTHSIATRNTEYEIFSVGGKSHTLGAVFLLNHAKPLSLGAPPVKPIGEEAHRQGALLDLDKHDWPWSIALIPLMRVDLFEIANNHLWRAPFAFRAWSSPAAPYMELPEAGKGGGELDWILYGLKTYYALLDSGFPLRPTAGSASGVHPVPPGFGRVYARVEGDFSFDAWFRALGEGRSFVTTGPMLFAQVDGKDPGAAFRAETKGPRRWTIRGAAVSDGPLAKLEIVVNGQVARSIPPANRKNAGGACESPFEESIEIAGTSWAAVRAFQDLPGGRVRFAHTGTFRFEIPGTELLPAKEEIGFLVERVRAEIARSSALLPPEALAEYEEALRIYQDIARRASRP